MRLRLRKRVFIEIVLFMTCMFLVFLAHEVALAAKSKKKAPVQKKNEEKKFSSQDHEFTLEILFQRQDVIWGFDFLPDGKVVFSERAGKLLIWDPKKSSFKEVKGAPTVSAIGQGGLLDVKVDPDFKKTNFIYLTYSEPAKGQLATTAMGRGELSKKGFKKFTKLFSAREPAATEIHFGSRLVFDGRGHIFFSVGDRHERPRVQDLGYHNGKIIRLMEDGSVPEDNPFANQSKALPEIWSLGHRNPQGLVENLETGEIWSVEMGPQGGDELNLIRRGKNYGWPVVTYGKEYSGEKVGEGVSKAGMEPPVAYWDPSISPSGMTIYTGSTFPKWKGNIFLACLNGQHMRRLVLQNQKVVSQEVLLADLNWRFRMVRTGPDGALYFSTDAGHFGRLK